MEDTAGLIYERGETMAKLNDLEGLYTQEVEALGYRLYHMEYVNESGMNILRFYIDHENGISLADCEKVSKRLSDILDEKDPITEDYNLEVSSPGIFRTLFTRAHMDEAVGEKVMVKTKKPVSDAKKFVGTLKAVHDHGVVILKDNSELEITFENLKSINIEVDL
jgi:ribosome maturation factor RimP